MDFQPKVYRIKASAGSGKTYTLTRSILALLAQASDAYTSGCAAPGSGPVTLAEILGVTFTNRAAAEMKERVLLSLKQMALEEVPPHSGWTPQRAAALLDSLIRQPGALNLRTIDSLIHLIVRLSALELNLPPEFEALFNEDELLEPLLDDLAEKARETDPDLAREYAGACRWLLASENFKGFLAGNRVRRKIAALTSQFLEDEALRDVSLAEPEAVLERLGQLRHNLRQAALQLRQALEGFAVNHHLAAALDKCCDPACPDHKLPVTSAMFAKEHLDLCLNKTGKGKKTRGQADAATCALYLGVCQCARALETEGKILADAMELMPMVRLARKALEELPPHQHTTGQIPAVVVPFLAGHALEGEYGVSQAFCRMGNRLTHILVDEFQDTSRPQWQAMKPLVVEALSRGGGLTIVGDVKQAIYGWREGDAELFDEVPADADLLSMATSAAEDTLPANWRSCTEIINWNNTFFSLLKDHHRAWDVMETLLGSEADPPLLAQAAVKLAHTFDDCVQEDSRQTSGGLVQLTLIPEMDASALQSWLEERLPRKVRALGASHAWSQMCILTQTNQQTAMAARWLLEQGIPVVTQGSLLLAEQPLIAQTAALLAFLDAPDDDMAFWAVLLGRDLLPPDLSLDLSGVRDWAVERLRGKGRSPALARAFRRDWPHLWEAVFAPLYDEAGLLTPYDTVQEIYSRWKVWERHPDEEGFLRRFLEIVYLAEQHGCVDLTTFLRYWEAKGMEERAPLPENMDAVRIMTIHKAKGLEADIVLIPWHNFSLRDRRDLQLWSNDSLQVLAPLSKAMGEQFYQARAENAQEAMHLLYVAWTRAVRQLHCFIQHPHTDPMSRAIHLLLEHLQEADVPFVQVDDHEWVWGGQPEAEPFFSMDTAVADEYPESLGESLADSPEPPPAPPSLEESPRAELEAWRPMYWLPRLKIFRSTLENWTLTPRRRGTLLHRCLEFLRVSGPSGGEPQADAIRAVRQGLTGQLLPNRQEVEEEFVAALTWFAGLPEARLWLRRGSPERALLDAEGKVRRVDLLVDGPEELTAVEYKSGVTGPLPAPAHVEQLGDYVRLLRQATGQPCIGVLVYVDRQELVRLDENGGAIQEAGA